MPCRYSTFSFLFSWYVSGHFRLSDIRNRKKMLFPVDLNTTHLSKKKTKRRFPLSESEILSVSPPQKNNFNPHARGKKDTWTLLRGTREPCAFFVTNRRHCVFCTAQNYSYDGLHHIPTFLRGSHTCSATTQEGKSHCIVLSLSLIISIVPSDAKYCHRPGMEQ